MDGDQWRARLRREGHPVGGVCDQPHRPPPLLRADHGGGRPEGKRPVYEVACVDPSLNVRWSTRRETITALTGRLVAEFEDHHERPPTAAEKLDLEQQATLATREAKHPPRSEAGQRRAWVAQATQLLGSGGIERTLHAVLTHKPSQPVVVDDAWVGRTAAAVITVVEGKRS